MSTNFNILRLLHFSKKKNIIIIVISYNTLHRGTQIERKYNVLNTNLTKSRKLLKKSTSACIKYIHTNLLTEYTNCIATLRKMLCLMSHSPYAEANVFLSSVQLYTQHCEYNIELLYTVCKKSLYFKISIGLFCLHFDHTCKSCEGFDSFLSTHPDILMLFTALFTTVYTVI